VALVDARYQERGALAARADQQHPGCSPGDHRGYGDYRPHTLTLSADKPSRYPEVRPPFSAKSAMRDRLMGYRGPVGVLLEPTPVGIVDLPRKHQDSLYKCPNPERYQYEDADETEQSEEDSCEAKE
jgi:hypothetical protein